MTKNIADVIQNYIEKDELLFDRESLNDEENTEGFLIEFEDFYIRIIIQENGEFIQFISTGYNWDSKFEALNNDTFANLSHFLMNRNGLKKLCKWGILGGNIYLNVDFSLEDSEFTYKQYERIFSIIFYESNEVIPKISKELDKKEPKFRF